MCLARVFPSDWEPEMDVLTDKPHRRSLLDHFSAVPDPRQAWRVAHPLPEVLLLVVCGTIAANDDYDDIVDWGEAHLSFLRRFSAFHFGLPCADWLRTLMNRIDPDLFSACFLSWVREWWPEVPDLIALDGKTSRRSYDRKAGRKALHLVSRRSPPTSAWCSARRLARRSRTRPLPSRRCSHGWRPAAISRGRW